MPKAITLEKSSTVFRGNHICSVDQVPFVLGDVVVFCPKCNAVYHARCWTYNGNKCATFGCSGSGVVEYPVPITQTVLNTTTSAIHALKRSISISPRTARLISWLATWFFAYLLSRSIQPDLAEKSKSWLLLIMTVLFAVAASSAYEAQMRRRYRGLTSDIAYSVQALVLGFLGMIIFEYLLKVVLPDSIVILGNYSHRPPLILIVGFTFTIASTAHLGAWNNSSHFGKRIYVSLRLITAVTVVFLGARVLLVLLDSDWLIHYPQRFLSFCIATAAGSGLGATLNDQIGLWTGKPHSGLRRIAETLISTFVLSGTGIIVGQLIWIYLLQDSLGEPGQAVPNIYHYFILSCATLGAAYGSSDQARSGLLGLFRFLAKLILFGAMLTAMTAGGYVSYAVVRDWLGITSEEYSIGIALGGAFVTLIILRALYKFMKDIASS